THWNNDVHSREQSGFAPYLLVTGEPGEGATGRGEDARRGPGREPAPPLGAQSSLPATPGPGGSLAAPQRAGGEPRVRAGGLRVCATDLVSSAGARIAAARVRLARDWYVRDGEWYPEVTMPLDGSFTIPDARNRIPGQRNQSLLVEVYVPRDARAGAYRGQLNVA